jgi:hypothetical protein
MKKSHIEGVSAPYSHEWISLAETEVDEMSTILAMELQAVQREIRNCNFLGEHRGINDALALVDCLAILVNAW